MLLFYFVLFPSQIRLTQYLENQLFNIRTLMGPLIDYIS